jgi:hypothetical protein
MGRRFLTDLSSVDEMLPVQQQLSHPGEFVDHPDFLLLLLDLFDLIDHFPQLNCDALDSNSLVQCGHQPSD